MNPSANHKLITTDDSGQPIQLQILQIKKTAHMLRAINHKLRQKIIELIDERKKITVSEIQKKILLKQAVASQQLAILRKAGFIIAKREGKFIYYSINTHSIKKLQQFIDQLLS